LDDATVNGNRNKLQGWKSDPMLDEEQAWHYLMAGSINLCPQYTWCTGCQHHFFDGPLENATIEEQNLEDVTNYMQIYHKVKAWKNNKENVEQPQCPTTHELIEKNAICSQAKEEICSLPLPSVQS
jgi:hypothetical protein